MNQKIDNNGVAQKLEKTGWHLIKITELKRHQYHYRSRKAQESYSYRSYNTSSSAEDGF